MADLVKKEEEEEEEEFGDWPLSVNEDMSLAQAVENEVQSLDPNIYPETPRKAVNVNMACNPGSKRKREEAEAWPTPATGRTNPDDVFITHSTTRLKSHVRSENQRSGLMSPSATPTPNRFREGNQPDDMISNPKDYDATEEVMEILKEKSLDEETSFKLCQVLNKYALRN